MRPGDYHLDTATLQLGPLTATQRGGKNASVTLDGKPIRLELRSCTTPFECQGYGGGDRRSLDVRADEELQAFATALDAKVLVAGMDLGLKGSGYKSLLKESKDGQYAPTFRQKITISEETGRSSCKFFDGAKRRLSDAEILDLSWRDLEFSCMSRVSSLYVNGPNWGLLCTPDAIKCRQTAACPFSDSEGEAEA